MLPALAATPAVADDGGIHVNFQPAGAAPAGYTADTGAAFNGTSGWQDLERQPGLADRQHPHPQLGLARRTRATTPS